MEGPPDGATPSYKAVIVSRYYLSVNYHSIWWIWEVPLTQDVQVQSHVVRLMDLRTCYERCPGRSWTCTVSPWFPTTPSLSLPRWCLYRLDFLLQIVNILGKFIYNTLPLLAKMVLTLVLLKFLLLLQKWLSFTPGGDRAIQPGSGPGLQHPRVLGSTSKSPVLWPNQHFSLGLQYASTDRRVLIYMSIAY